MSIGDGWRRFAPVASLCVFLVGAGQSTTVNASELARCNVFAASPYNIIVAPSVITWRDVSDNRFDDEQNSPVAQFIANPGYDWSLIARSIARQAAAPISGLASTYNPLNNKDIDAGSLHTASGEIYDPDGWTAAIQIDLRWIFSGVRYGRNYRPSFALVEAGDKRAIVRINDVGPLAPGRIIDLNTRAMHYFDPSMRTGVLNVSVTPLMGNDFVAGPIEPPAVVMAGNLPTIR